MMARRPLVAGNWKMNGLMASAGELETIIAGARGLSNAAGLIHPHAAPDDADADVPTTILVDRSGIVRWLYRSPAVIVRLSPDEVLQAIDRHLR